MGLTTGTRLGPYEIVDPIGAGGMGEVYRARDTVLNRDVAIKVLPETLAGDPDRLARFQREAEALAALNHPNIAHVYGLEKSGGTPAIVMELVEGPTLGDRIKAGAIPLDQALPIARQIAEALEAAHERGIIHRDLKPANVKVKDDGTVKVLDFGLAKVLDPGPRDPWLQADAMNSPTLTNRATQMGVILGTAAYMAPEQARGKAVDKRADIWAFGVVLYEMLVGKPLFGAHDVSDTLAHVLTKEPDWTALPAATPRRIRELLRRCLTKDAKQRLHDIADARLEIDEAATEPAGASGDSSGATRPAAWRRALPVGAAVVLTALLAGFAAWTVWPTPEPGLVSRFDYDLPDGQVFTRTGRPVLALSRDGRQVVYNTRAGLFRRTMEDREARLIPGTEIDMASPFLSPDGLEVGYFDYTTEQLKRVSVGGGAAAVIGPATNPYGVSWETDGTILFGQEDGIYRVSADGGTPVVVIQAEAGEAVHGPQLLPDGDSVLFVVTTATGEARWDEARIVVESIRTHVRKELGITGSDARYVSKTGHLVYAVEDALYAVAFDPDRLTVVGGSVSLVQGVRRASSAYTGAAFYAVSETGTLVYARGTAYEKTLVWVDRLKREEPLGAPPRPYRYPRISPDGARVALSVNETNADIWTWDLARKVLANVTSSAAASESYPLWTPAGDRIVFSSDRDGPSRLYWISADGAGDAEPLTEGVEGEYQNPTALSLDGLRLVFRLQATPGGGSMNLRQVFLDGSYKTEDLLSTEFNELNAELSPDGHWMAYQSDRSDDRYEVYVSPFPNVKGGRWPVSSRGGIAPAWNPKGGELFYVQPGPPLRLMSVTVGTDRGLQLGPPVELFDVTDYYVYTGRTYDVDPDGQRFLMVKRGEASADAPATIEFVLNWFTELKAKVPSGR